MNNKIFKTKKQSVYGFTIVELLIVIVIIGILVAITLVSYVGISKRATEAGLTSDLDGAKRQLELYKIEYESYPTILDTNKCPTSPNNDTKYCLKNKDFVYTTTDNGLTYTLKLTKSDITFEVTNDSTPKIAEATPAEPTLPESDWITIGTQRWARKNLNVGTMISIESYQTDNGIVEKYCRGDSELNCETYGGFYIWNEAMKYGVDEGAEGVCPAGSHIPSDNEWKTLEIQLGMTQATADSWGYRGTVGDQLLVGGSSGFNLIFPGYSYYAYDTYSSRYHNMFHAYDWSSELWSSSKYDSNSAWSTSMVVSSYYSGYDQRAIARSQLALTYGFSIRCLGN